MGNNHTAFKAWKKNNMILFIPLTCLSIVWLLHNLLYTPRQHLLRSIILTLARPMWGAMVSTRIPTVTWWRRSCSRTSASPTLRQLATPRTGKLASPGFFNNCTGVIETKIERVCFDVNELVCDLVEAVHYETLEETYQVQRCFTGKDRVCDTTYKIDMTTKDDYQCTNVETPNCY